MSPAEAQSGNNRPKADKNKGDYRPPGYGWSARLSGLSQWSEWRGFFLVTVAVFLVVIIGGYILQAFGVW